MLVVDLDRLAEGLVGEFGPGATLQIADDALVALLGELLAVGGLAVLRVGHRDVRDAVHPVLPVLRERLEGVAQGGNDDGGHSLVLLHEREVEDRLDDSAIEGGEIRAGARDLCVGAPHAEGRHAHRMDQLFGRELGDAAHHFLPRIEETLELPARIVGDPREFLG